MLSSSHLFDHDPHAECIVKAEDISVKRALSLLSLLVVKRILDLVDAFVRETREEDRVNTLRHWVSLVVLAGQNARERHAGWGQPLGEDLC